GRPAESARAAPGTGRGAALPVRDGRRALPVGQCEGSHGHPREARTERRRRHVPGGAAEDAGDLDREGSRMQRRSGRVEKAYRNLDFLNSSEARVLRIIAEYLEPAARFRRQDVEDTIVFFGSARALPPDQAREQVAAARKALEEARHPTE